MRTRTGLAALVCFAFPPVAYGATLQIGPHSKYRSLGSPQASSALKDAKDGDVIEIEGGATYRESCRIQLNGITLKGVGKEKPHFLPDPSKGLALGQGVFAVEGNDIAFDNLEISGAVQNRQACGIRFNGKNLTIRNCYIHNNSDGVMTKISDSAGDVTIEDSVIADSRVLFWAAFVAV